MQDGEKSSVSRGLTALVVLICLAYVAALIKITLIKGTSIPRLVQNLLAERAPLRALNLVPFRTIFEYLQYRQGMNFLRWFANIFGNMLVFVPLGLYLPMVFQQMKRFSRSLFAIVLFSISFETLQYLLGTGSCDIDDFLLNTVGGSLGYCMFLIVARVAPKRLTALSLTLALSICFAVAGYLIAYREFGIYLGLATLTEEVQGGERIPGRLPDAVGTVGETRGNLLILVGHVALPGAKDTLRAGAVAPEGSGEIEIQVGPGTRFYDKQSSLEGHKMTTRYVPYTPPTPADVPKEAWAMAWGQWDTGRLLAEVVCTTRAPNVSGTVSVVTVQKTTGGVALPRSRPSLKGHFQRFVGDDVVVHEILETQRGGSTLAITTATEERFRLTPATVFCKRRILRGGREVFISPGSRDDMVTRTMLEVWGRMHDGVLQADVVCINVFK